MTKTLIPVAAYLRMSSDKQDKSIADQRTELLAYATKHGYRIVAWYTDEAISGWKNKERHGFHRLIADAAGDAFKGVLCWDQARFSRFDPMEANYFWHILRTAGVFLETAKEGRIDWTSLGGWLTASVQQHGKAEYVRSLAQDCTRGRRAAVIAGRWISSAPYGYRKKGDRLALGDPAEVATVRRIFEMRAQGMGRPTIALTLNNENIPSPRGKIWIAKQVRMILLNESYLGNQVVGRWSAGKFCRITDKMFVNKGTHPAIIDEELWEKVESVNATRANHHPARSGKKPGGPLSGLLVCSQCKAVMFYEKRNDRYICSTHAQTGACINGWIRNSLAMRLVIAKIRDLILMGSRKLLAEEIAANLGKKKQAATPDTAKQLADIERKIAAAAERLLDVEPGLVAAVRDAMRKLQQRRDELRTITKAAKAERTATSPEAIANKLWELDDVLCRGDIQAVRLAISQLIERIELQFERNARNRRQWLAIGGRIVFFQLPTAGTSPRKSTNNRWSEKLTRKDFEG